MLAATTAHKLRCLCSLSMDLNIVGYNFFDFRNFHQSSYLEPWRNGSALVFGLCLMSPKVEGSVSFVHTSKLKFLSLTKSPEPLGLRVLSFDKSSFFALFCTTCDKLMECVPRSLSNRSMARQCLQSSPTLTHQEAPRKTENFMQLLPKCMISGLFTIYC